MPTPLEDIEAGVRAGSWKKVARGFARLTGTKLPVPEAAAAAALPPAARAALAFYAEPASWLRGGDEFDPTPAPVARDRGQLAREALEKVVDPDAADADEAAPPPARPVPQEAPPPPPGPVLLAPDRFRMPAGEPAGGKRVCRREPFVPGMVNQFRDDGVTEAASRDFDRKVTARLRPTPRRDPAPAARPVAVRCDRCQREFEADPYDVRPGGEDGMLNVCPGCIRGAIPGRD